MLLLFIIMGAVYRSVAQLTFCRAATRSRKSAAVGAVMSRCFHLAEVGAYFHHQYSYGLMPGNPGLALAGGQRFHTPGVLGWRQC